MSARPTGYWFEDPKHPGTARWFDGRRPTEHVVRIAELPEATPPPPPLDRNPLDPPAPAGGWAPPAHPSGRPASAAHLARPEVGEPVPEFLWGSPGPWWAVSRARVLTGAGATVLVLVLAFVATLVTGGREPAAQQLTATATAGAAYSPEEVTEAAQQALALVGTSGVTLDDLEAFLPLTCQAAEAGAPSRIAGRLSQFRFARSALPAVVRSLRAGARALCPLALDRYTTLFDELPAMVLTTDGGSISVSVSTGGTALGGTAVAPGQVITSTGTSSATVTAPTSGGGSATVAAGVVREGSSCSVEGATATSSGGTAVCSSSTSCQSSGAGLLWRSVSC